MRHRIGLAVGLVLFVAGVIGICLNIPSSQTRAGAVTNKIIYTKDPRTGLCFAISISGERMGMTCVPCLTVNEWLTDDIVKP